MSGVKTVENKRFLNVKDVAELMEVSESLAYKTIKKMNDELEQAGKITVAGKISRRYFEDKFYI